MAKRRHQEAAETPEINQWLRELFDHSQSAVGFARTDGTLLAVNPAFEVLTGYRRDDLLYEKSYMDLTPEEYKALDAEKVREALDTGASEEYEKEYIRKDGRRVPILINVFRVEGSSGEVVGTGAIVRDISTIKTVEGDLRKSESRFRRIFESNMLAVAFWDENGAINDANDAFLNMVGYTRNDLETGLLDWQAITPPEYAHLDQAAIKEIEKNGCCSRFEKAYIRKDGSRIEILIGAASLEGKSSGGIAYVLDITESKKAEEELKQKDRDIRRAYVNIFSAVTNDKLLLLTDQEISGALGDVQGDTHMISSFGQLAESRDYLRKELEFMQIGDEYISNLIIACGEAVANGVKHAGSCNMQICTSGEIIQVRVSDNGPGIDFSILPKATLTSGFSTKKSLGLGYSLILEMCDRVLLSTSGQGTTVVLEIGGGTQSYDDILSRESRRQEAA